MQRFPHRGAAVLATALLVPCIARPQSPPAQIVQTPASPGFFNPGVPSQAAPARPPGGPSANQPGVQQAGTAQGNIPQANAPQPNAPQPNARQPGAPQPGAPQPGTSQPGTAPPGTAPPAAQPAMTQPGPGQGPPATQPPGPAPDVWLPRTVADVQALDKVAARVQSLALRIGVPQSFGSLTIILRACMVRPPDQPQDSAAFLEITDAEAKEPGFRGWMFASEPEVAMLESPIYDLRLNGCHS
jgi:hypothetical protein